MLFYLLIGFSVVSCLFLLMIAAQILTIEKTVTGLTERTEVFVKNIYEKG